MFLGLLTVLEYAKDLCGGDDDGSELRRDNTQVYLATSWDGLHWYASAELLSHRPTTG